MNRYCVFLLAALLPPGAASEPNREGGTSIIRVFKGNATELLDISADNQYLLARG